MATKRMLVDAIHPEETRIVVTAGSRLEEFDFESASRRQLRGNIYLAKVTRVEPSLQAAFIEYGGNRHGFLAFSEIHPDYYQIPVADREALLRDEEAEDRAEAEANDAPSVSEAAELPKDIAEGTDPSAEAIDVDSASVEGEQEHSHIEEAPHSNEPVESVGGADALEEVPAPPRRRFQKYKIQEVIKRRQVMLVQVVKEERGNKGAALTTYLSLAGRYSVLMPNTSRGGGISRKITNAADRKRLKEITSDLEVPPGMGVILRTAGASRTKAEVKRDFEYLMRLWENVRSLTLRSQAPCLVYEEGSLIKRTIRDLYNKEIDEVFVAGENAFREAKDFMRMIMPSHAKNVQLYTEDQPLFSKFGIESQLDQMFSPQVTLPSGGYIVINPTEALVSIDVNSGRATKEHNIEDTALQTNLEAAEEISRQLRLRDLAGLIVIDFIDMMENRSNRAVERKLKDCLKNDRARIQVGRISHFGLMEMSRQRIRFGVVESSTHTCPVCLGTGLVRSVESLALMVMRHVEDQVMRRPGQSVNVRVPFEVALYILNTKRDSLTAIESRNAISITVTADPKLTGSQFAVEKGEPRANQMLEAKTTNHVRVDSASIPEMDDAVVDEADEEEIEASEGGDEVSGTGPDGAEGEPSRRRRRRRRGRGDRPEEGDRTRPQPARAEPVSAAPETVAGEDTDEDDDDSGAERVGAPEAGDDEPRRRRRRGRRGGRRNRRFEDGSDAPPTAGETTGLDAGQAAAPEFVEPASELADDAASVLPVPVEAAAEPATDAPAPEKPKRARRSRKAATDTDSPVEAPLAAAASDAPAVEETAAETTPSEEKPKRKPRARKPKASVEAAEPAVASAGETEPEPAPAPSAGEPVLETVAAGDGTAAEAGSGSAGDSRRSRRELPPEGVVTISSSTPEREEPKKKGWWQRGFLG